MSAAAPLAPLDWQRVPLDGRVLIEASAGTGKTYQIGLIYLRVLLERPLGVEQVIVATFTDAAAQELRDRLRLRLIEAERWLQCRLDGRAADGDSPLHAYLAERIGDEADARAGLRRIRLARADFDRAPILTIHALCQRIQREYPLESGAGFADDPLADELALIGECVEDFWRRRVLTAPPDDPALPAALATGLDGFKRLVASVRAAGPECVLAPAPVDLDALRGVLASLDEADGFAVPLRMLLADPEAIAWNGTKKASRALIEALAAADRPGRALFALDDEDLARLCGEACAKWQNKARRVALEEQPCIRRLAAAAEALLAARAQALPALRAEAVAFCEQALAERVRRRGVQTFSMQIDGVHARLCGAAADTALADRLFAAFPVALVDEFQDTDRRQFAIFDRLYREADGTRRGGLIMIGDPKQAIYAFRGGDIAAYLAAARGADERRSLATNYRSSGRLVGALNAFYAHTGGGFGALPVRYQPVAWADPSDGARYTRHGAPVAAPLVFHRFRGEAADERGRPLEAQARLEALALEDCANRIAELLGDGHAIDGRPVGPGDVAVLLSTHAEVAALRERLERRGVPCAGSGRGSVFAGEAAADLVLLLHAVCTPGDAAAVRGALSTRLLGADYRALAAWDREPAAFERERERFVVWRERARRRGVLAVIGEVIAARAPDLLADADGERVLTDLRHLGELLAEQERRHHGLDALVAWLSAMRRDEAAAPDEADARRLRVESDARRVQLLTIHASKGLEYPIVFVPLAWRERSAATPASLLRFHDAEGRLCVDLGSERHAAHRQAHMREDQEERLRLLYVALTRAREAVHVHWVERRRTKSAADDAAEDHGRSALGRLVDEVLSALGGAPVVAAATAAEADAAERAVLERLASLPGVAAAAPHAGPMPVYRPAAAPRHRRAAQAPLPALRPPLWLHSFSGLLRDAAPSEAAGASDEPAVESGDAALEGVALPDADDARLLALSALRGPRFGDAVHEAFENAAPGPFWPQQRARIEDALRPLGVRGDGGAEQAALIEAAGRMIERVRRADLGDGLRLDALGPAARVAEFEFQLPVRQVGLARLRALCALHGAAEVVPATLDGVRLNGMLTGFVDLVFEAGGRYHVLDYKTNWLGGGLAAYRGAALEAAMHAHHYDLQALLYTVALHRYLRQRLRGYAPERQLGESWYLFVRAAGLDGASGIWRRRWPPGLIAALDAAFAGAETPP
ncbi:MAG TPA: UvrD-helicase domain-containing protein [Dokdonella sp.]|uniref:UvrD-helicase domain-containing protein n=1 Tax=Dokdonella sp. TaxID=2291710 RepID=UPI002BB679B7|nr:UvrD-helicase domain-containing protein [Dokdonella sp.]HUD41675.1 UvrD-helicase domain-containing protein [Dokdonella sp.]